MLKFRTYLYLREEEEHYPFHDNGKTKNRENNFTTHDYHFKAKNGHYGVTFSHDNNPKHVDLTFSHLQPQKTSIWGRKLRGNRRVYKDQEINHSAGLDARKILNTVHAVAKHHVTKNPDIEHVHFTGVGRTRARAYDTMVKHHDYKSKPDQGNDKYGKGWTVKVR